MTITVQQLLDSETLHMPQLRPLIGKQVEITIREMPSEPGATTDRWQPLRALAGSDLVDPDVVMEHRNFDAAHQRAPAP
ncbi:MAG: hypothetical protein WD872_11255 [Pirellulaceae bacterium]